MILLVNLIRICVCFISFKRKCPWCALQNLFGHLANLYILSDYQALVWV
jgi:hypothetical protein